MAKEAAGQAAGEAAANVAFANAKPAKSSKKLLLFVILPLLLMLGGGGAYYFLVLKKKQDQHAEAAPPPPPKPSVFYNLPGLVANLTPVRGRLSVIKVTVALELEDSVDVARVQSVMPRIVASLQAFLRELRVDELSGTAHLSRVREELLDRVNQETRPTIVKNVLFQEVVVQ